MVVKHLDGTLGYRTDDSISRWQHQQSSPVSAAKNLDRGETMWHIIQEFILTF